MPDTTIKRAIIAVYDKTGIAEFAKALVDEFGIEIISTGGTAKHLKDAGVPVTMVEEVTGFPEMLDGRVKTLHPKVHAGILADRSKPEHMRQLEEHGIKPIDMVVVNLYPFEDTIAKPDCTFDEAIEMIDIGGPCMLRAAAKNHKHVVVLTEPHHYRMMCGYLQSNGECDVHAHEAWLVERAWEAFWKASTYDAAISMWLARHERAGHYRMNLIGLHLEEAPDREMRYGENPHQSARLYELGAKDLKDYCGHPFNEVEEIGKCKVGISFNNYVDSNAALELCRELTRSELSTPGGLEPAVPRPDRENCSRGDEEPRTSVRAAHRKPIAMIADTSLQEPDPHSACWLLTWTTYGSWLPGDDRGFVSRAPRTDGTHAPRNEPETPYDVGSSDLLESAKGRMKGDRVTLGSDHAVVLADSFFESAKTHGIAVISFAIMTDHVHLLCQSQDSDGAKLLQLFKGAASRRLSQSIPLNNAPRWWSEGGSKSYIRKGDDPAAAIEYVCSQKSPLIVRCFDSSRNRSVSSTSGAARTEVRGSSHEANAQTPSSAARTEVRGSSDEMPSCSLSTAPTENATHSAEVAHACCFIKHTNACGVAVDADPIEAYRRAYLGDPNAAMGGILAVNFAVNADFADAVMNSLARWGKDAGAGAFFVEVWLAPAFDEAAINVIRTAKKWGERVRLLAVGDRTSSPGEGSLDFKRITGGMLVQDHDLVGLNEADWKVVSDRRPTEAEMADLRLAWLTCKHTKSNAITICKDGMLIGNGAGQMSRVMSCRIATWLAKENGHEAKLAGSVAASDAFFPFRDGPDILADAGVTAIIQPGGSKRDEDTIKACNERGLAMIFTGTRHFKH